MRSTPLRRPPPRLAPVDLHVQYEGNNNIRERGHNVKFPLTSFPLSFRVLHSGHNARGRTEKSNLFVSPNNIRVRKTRYPLICSHFVKKGDNSNINLSQFQDFCGKCLLLHCEYDVNFLAACSTKESSDLEISTPRDELRDWKNNYSYMCHFRPARYFVTQKNSAVRRPP